ncbi:FAD-binding oxidoreductase [Roseateles sp. L2-2]|uniref:FAD-binding oxidoreductase n=1 Tax=Roseateles sp. L2-2 TaxID=3422597 RepID=UPI003D35EFA6
MDRRVLLGAGVGALAGSWLTGCGGGGGSSGAPVTPAPSPDVGPYAALARQMKGQLLVSGHADFDAFRRPANARFDAVVPQALARCAGPEDVSAALNFALTNKIAFTARSGGHSYLAASTGTGLVIDTGPMDSVRMDGDIAVVGAGAKVADVYRALLALPQPRLLPSGSCPTVGISGITMGGGFGFFQRAYGLTCDALVGATLVGADGLSVTCDATRNADLFWALRGGGGGNFGIVTELRFQTQPLPAFNTCWGQFGSGDLVGVALAWQAWSATLPESVWSQCQIGVDSVGKMLLSVFVVSFDGATALRAQWDRFLITAPAAPTAQDPAQVISAAALLMNRCADLTAVQCHLPSQASGGQMPRVAMTASSDFFAQPIPAAGMQTLVDALAARGRAGGGGVVIFDQMGGAIARVAADATAFPHRDALFSAQYLTENLAGSGTPAQLDDNARWTHSLRTAMSPWSSGGAYVNYPDAAITDAASAYYGGNLTRLRAVKRAVDANGVFKTPLATL